jgi:pyruvate/2-oxoglutarate dehydrogenase complex dihydrolipoamide acyltransferase (E2) component
MTLVALSITVTLSGCSHQPPPEPLRAVRTVEIRYDKIPETDRYFGAVQSRYEVDQAFRVGGKVVTRKVDVGQKVRQGDVIAVVDDADYKLAAEAARQQLSAAEAQARQAESDRKRLNELKTDGSVSPSDDEKAQSNAQTTRATADAEARRLELARNRLEYTVLRASQDGVVTSVKFEVGQVVAEGPPIVSIAKDGEPEIVVNVPEDQLSGIQGVAVPRPRSRARRTRPLRSCCGNWRRKPLRQRAPSELGSSLRRPGRCRLAQAQPSWSIDRSPTVRLRRSPRLPFHRTKVTPQSGRFVEKAPSRSERCSSSTCPCTPITTTKCSYPGRPPASSSSPQAFRRWRRV